MSKRLIYIFSISAIASMLFIIISIFYQRDRSNYETVAIELKTIVCENCVKTVKQALKQDEGIINADISLKAKTVSIRYDNAKTDIHKIESIIVKSGYDANDKIADSTAYRNLSNCCQIWGDGDDYMKLREKKSEGCKGGCCSQ